MMAAAAVMAEPCAKRSESQGAYHRECGAPLWTVAFRDRPRLWCGQSYAAVNEARTQRRGFG